jgi:endonuclease-3
VGRTQRARFVLDTLRQAIDEPATELRYSNPYELLIAVILSAQCTDARVNQVTPDLFAAFPTVEALHAAEPDDVFPYIQSVTFPNNKAKYLATMGTQVVEDFGGTIPRTVDALQTLSGVGHKTAQVVANVAFGTATLPVDTHVYRVAHRIGLVTGEATTPDKVGAQLKRIIPRADWGDAHHLLILHGRYTCTARRPDCDACPVAPRCRYYARRERLPDPLPDLDASAGRYYCKTHDHYFDTPATRTDRYGTEQIACPWGEGSMNVFRTDTGAPTKQVKDYRVNG